MKLASAFNPATRPPVRRLRAALPLARQTNRAKAKRYAEKYLFRA